MNKTLPLMLVAFAVVALAATPSASACQYMGPGNPTVNYVVCDRDYVTQTEDYATQTAADAVAFASQEAGDAVTYVVDLVLGIPLP